MNYLDRELRKDLHERVRETSCFGRDVNKQMERAWHSRTELSESGQATWLRLGRTPLKDGAGRRAKHVAS